MFPVRMWAGFPARPVGGLCAMIVGLSAVWAEGPRASISADFIPPQPVAASSDLDLTRENARQAEAFAHFIRGSIAEENAETDEALAAFQRVLDLDPSCADIAVKVAFEMAKRGEIAEGINTLKDAIKVSPKNSLLLLYLSQLYARHLKKYDLAIRYAKQAIELDPTSIAAHACLYELHLASGDPKSALATLDRAGKLKNDDADFWLQLADLAIRASEKSASPDGKGGERVITFLRKAEEAAGSEPEAMAKVADAYLVIRQAKLAIAIYRKIIAGDPESESPVTVNAEDKLARALYADKNPDAAIGVLEGLAAKHPERHDTHAMLGELLEEKGDFEGALQAFRSSLLLDPNQPLNHLRVSDLLLQIGQPEEAVAQLRIARERFPDLPQVTYSLAVALGRANRHGEALAMFEAAISEAHRSNPQLLNGAFFFAYGAAAERADQLDLAAQLLQKSVELDPQNAAQSLNYLGYTWVDRNMRLDEARKLIDKALGLDPENPAFLDSLGWYHYRAGHFDEALPILLRAAERIEPEDAVIFEHIGDTYAALKQTAEAIAYWKKSATLDPKNTAVAEKLRKAEAGSTGGTAAPEKNR